MIPSHLQESAAKHLGLSDDLRIKQLRTPVWVGYSRAQQILGMLDDLLKYPPSSRMPNMLIVGETHNGKTHLVERFCSLHKAEDNPDGSAISAPVLYIEAPPVPDESRFFNSILDALFAPYKPHDSIGTKEGEVYRQLRNVGLKVLVIDEIQHLLSGSTNRQREFLNVIKSMGSKLKVPIVAAGTLDAFRAVRNDPQVSNRFEPALLPLWKNDVEFARLLASFERLLPLHKPSGLTEAQIRTRLFTMSEGIIGELWKVLHRAAVESVKRGVEQINSDMLDAIGWVPPSGRKRLIDTMAEK